MVSFSDLKDVLHAFILRPYGCFTCFYSQATNTLNFLVRMMTELETQLVSVERIVDYTDVESEVQCSL